MMSPEPSGKDQENGFQAEMKDREAGSMRT